MDSSLDYFDVTNQRLFLDHIDGLPFYAFDHDIIKKNTSPTSG